MKDTIYDHYIAIDWSIENMAIARMTKNSNNIKVIDVPSDIKERQIPGKKNDFPWIESSDRRLRNTVTL